MLGKGAGMSASQPNGLAIIAWGSLVWSPRELAATGPWTRSGPALPIEFSRISTDGRLTLVIDEKHGAWCPTWVRRSVLGLGEAVANLATREGCPSTGVGWADVDGRCSADAAIASRVALWCERSGFRGALWTALRPTFRRTTGRPFSVQAAIGYLEGLRGEQRRRAFEYVRRAPTTTRTPLRAAFESRWPEPS